ncbi:integrase catalytic domain-containing protein [Trichonephila clavipes]|uniref:Integrase catalytic domain-containing protein n=1 Tax=Trichonephila clavipes TaxID=2585209 RepID=A0A8X6WIR1_TRICX|nr:integrase catalytic domain-containing protein [Trichonephila clavipes]
MSSEPDPLPLDRVADCVAFEIVGIDLAGPLFLKSGEKVWIALFTCANFHAIHLELVNSLTTDSFLLSLRRFIARRGRHRTIYSDNGTNFRCAFNDLSKPLTYVSEDPGELIPLTPAMFLGESHSYSVSDIEEVDSQKLSKRIKYRRKLFNDLRQRLRKEYLSELIQKCNEKSSREPKVGEIVLFEDDNKKRLFWPMAKIIELIPGRDGKIRTVKLKTQHGTVLRPVQRVYPLEIRANENCVTQEVAEHRTTPLSVKGDIDDVSSELDNGG